MSKTGFFLTYAAFGVAGLVLCGILDVTGALLPSFGRAGNVDTKSRQGSWYIYKKPVYTSSGGGRSPSGGGSYGGGGWSGGK